MNRHFNLKTWGNRAVVVMSLAGAYRMLFAHLFKVSTFRLLAEAGIVSFAILAAVLTYLGIHFCAHRFSPRREDRDACLVGVRNLFSPFLLLWVDVLHIRLGKLSSLGNIALIISGAVFLYLCSERLNRWHDNRLAGRSSKYLAPLKNPFRFLDWFIAGGLFLIFLLMYAKTRYPGFGGRIHYGDSAEFQYLGLVTGISHPTGYPVYFIIVKALKTLFWFVPPRKLITFVSVLFGASTIGFTYLASVRYSGSRVGGIVSAVLLGVSITFWSLATEPEVYALNSFFISVVSYLTICFSLTKRYAYLYGGMFLYAISFGNHLTVLFLLPGILYVVLKTDLGILRNYRALLTIGAFVLIGASSYLYLYFLSNFGSPVTFNTLGKNAGLLKVFRWATASQFHKSMFDFSVAELLTSRARVILELFIREFSLVGLFTLFAGVVTAVSRKQAAGIRSFLLLSLVFHLMFAVNYRIPDLEVMFPPAYFYLVVLASSIFMDKRAILCKLALFVFVIAYLVHINITNVGVGNTSNDAYYRVKEALTHIPRGRPIYLGKRLMNYHTSFMLKYMADASEFRRQKHIKKWNRNKTNRNAVITEEARREISDKGNYEPIGGVLLNDFVESNKNQVMLWVAQDIQSRGMNTPIGKRFNALGSREFPMRSPSTPYIGVSYKGRIVFERGGPGHRLIVKGSDIAKKLPLVAGLDVRLVSTVYREMKKSYSGTKQGERSSIRLQGQEYGKGLEGINVVVVNSKSLKVMSSKNFEVNIGNEYSSDTIFQAVAPVVERKK